MKAPTLTSQPPKAARSSKPFFQKNGSNGFFFKANKSPTAVSDVEVINPIDAFVKETATKGEAKASKSLAALPTLQANKPFFLAKENAAKSQTLKTSTLQKEERKKEKEPEKENELKIGNDTSRAGEKLSAKIDIKKTNSAAAKAGLPKISPKKLAKSQTQQTATNFFNSPASTLAQKIPNTGNRFFESFNQDRESTLENTPELGAELKTAGLAAPPAPPKITPTPAANIPNWNAPPTKVKHNDAPKFEPKGESDPKQLDNQINQEAQQAKQQQQAAAKGVSSLAGGERVQGKDMRAASSLALQNASIRPKLEVSSGMTAYLNMPMPDSFRAKVDMVAKPEMLDSMSDIQSQVSEAIEKRDTAQAESIAKAQNDANELGAKAQVAQADTVDKSRQKIQSKKEKGIAESEAILTDYQHKAGDAKASQFQQIENRIAQDDQRVQTKFDEADKKIKEEESKAEDEKKAAKKKAKKKKKKRSFWQKVGDAISSVVDAIADAVKKIGEALKKVVKGIISAAQKFATGIIDAARNFVVNAIQAFAKIAKGFLTVALAAFPGIRDKVIGLIDDIVSATVEMIDMIADQLKEGINYLVDKLNTIIDFVSNFYESLIQGGLAMLKAVLTGNFDELPKIAFMTACNALGLPGEEFWMILMKAKDQALSIIKDPIGFLKNLLKAGKKGFMQFMSNVAKHLEKGLFGWLFGKLTEAGIELPKKFDAAGIFFLVRQVLGATWGYVRARIVNIVGEENMERLEGVADYFQMLFTEGPMAVYNELKGQLTALKPTIIKEIQSWVITTVIQKAVVKLMAMLIPGSGFVQAIWGMWQTLQFFIENIKDIADLVNTVLDSLGLISKGLIGSAAKFVEKVMIKTLPLVFRFMAKLIGLGGISKKIAKIMAKIRKPVNKAIDSTIGKIARGGKAMFNKAKKGVKKGWNKAKTGAKKLKAGASNIKEGAIKWWKKRKKFKTKSGQTHSLYFKGNSEKSAVPMVASPPMTVKAKLRKWKTRITPEASPEVKAAKSLISQAESVLATDANSPKLASLLKQLFNIFGQEVGGDVDSMSPDEKKAAARDKFVFFMKDKKEMGKAEIEKVLLGLKEEFALSKVEFEGQPSKPEVRFYASKALLLPLDMAAGLTEADIEAGTPHTPDLLPANSPSSIRNATFDKGETTSTSGDDLRATNYDEKPTPMAELISHLKPFNSAINKQYFKTNTGLPFVDMGLEKTARPGKVEALSSTFRSGRRVPKPSETEVGRYGAFEEFILRGDTNNYNGGHLMGDQLMDSNNAFLLSEFWNLAPQIKSFNSPIYSGAIEAAARSALAKNSKIEYKVEVRYPDTEYSVDLLKVVQLLLPSSDLARVHFESVIPQNTIVALSRRVPGYWKAEARVVSGATDMDSQFVRGRTDVERQSGFVSPSVGSGSGITSPTGPEIDHPSNPAVPVIYTLITSSNTYEERHKKNISSFQGTSSAGHNSYGTSMFESTRVASSDKAVKVKSTERVEIEARQSTY